MVFAWNERQIDTRYVNEQGRGDEEYRDPEAPVTMGAHPVGPVLLSVARMRPLLMVRVSLSFVCHERCVSSSGAGANPLCPLRSPNPALLTRS